MLQPNIPQKVRRGQIDPGGRKCVISIENSEKLHDNFRMSGDGVSFAKDILPLFRHGDVACMARFGVSLNEFGYMSDATGDHSFADHANARNVYARLTGAAKPQMPKGGPFWSDAQLQLLNQWMSDGFLA